MTTSPHPRIDLAAARVIARGDRQKIWLEKLLHPEIGLLPGDDATGRWAASQRRRTEAFVDRLRQAGYIIESRPPSPERMPRDFITGFHPNAGAAYRVVQAVYRDRRVDAAQIHADVWLLVETLTSEQVAAAEQLAESWTSDVSALIGVVERLL